VHAQEVEGQEGNPQFIPQSSKGMRPQEGNPQAQETKKKVEKPIRNFFQTKEVPYLLNEV